MTTPPVVSITDELIAELEAAAKVATPGPWHIEIDEDSCSGAMFIAGGLEQYFGSEIARLYVDDDAIYMMIANPATILALLAHITDLKQQLAAASVDAERSYLRGLIDQKNTFESAYSKTSCWTMCENKTSDGLRAMDAAIDAARNIGSGD